MKIKFTLIVLFSLLPMKQVFAADIYVDINGVNIEEDGSEINPYHSISTALVKAATNPDYSRQILVKSGGYQEELVLPDNTSLSGESKDTVVINRENQNGTTVTSGKNCTIENLTIRGGNYGMVIPAYKNSTIRNCIVEKTKRIGIWIKKNNKSLSNAVEIWDSIISNNSKKGLYGESRFIYFINNRFEGNGEEGVDFRSKINGTISRNTISSNGEGGVEAEIRNVALEISGNTLAANQSNGITLNNRTDIGGKIIIKNNTITDNKRYGIRCTGTKTWSNRLWRKSIKVSDNSFSANKKKNIAPSCHSK